MQFTKTEISKIAKDILAQIKKGETATLITLEGDLGAGKTTLTQALAKELGVKEKVISPTFVIMKKYETKGKHSRLVHIDAYRLNSSKEILTLGWQEIISDPENLIVLEWPQRIKDVLPKNIFPISLEHVSDEERKIKIGK